MNSAAERLTAIEYLRSIAGILVFFGMLTIMAPIILILLIITLGGANNFVIEKVAPLIVRPVFFVIGIRFRIQKHVDLPHFPAVYIINHSSTLDILTILALGLPRVRFVAKWQLQYNPLFFLLGRLTSQVFIRREQSEKAIKTLQKNVARIQKNKLSVLLAPEGSRKHPGVIGPFKKGPFRMAMDLSYPIVPVYFEGNRELSRGGLMFTKPGTCTAHIHPPVDTSGWSMDTLDREITKVRNCYLRWSKQNSQQADHGTRSVSTPIEIKEN